MSSSPILAIDFKLDNSARFLIDNTRTDYLMQILRKDPCAFERNVILLFYNLCKKKRIKIVDIGANIGLYSLLGATIQSEIHIDAFEPSPSNFKILNQNIQLNKLESVLTFEKALGLHHGNASLFIPAKDEISSVASLVDGFTLLFHDSVNAVQIEMDTLDRHYAEHLDSIDLLKIDAEFYENEILEGGKQLIAHSRPVVICEVLFHEVHRHKFEHPKKIHDDRHSYRIEKYFKDRDYLMYAIGISGILKIENLHHHPDDRNFLFLPVTEELSSLLFIPYTHMNFIDLVFAGRNGKHKKEISP